MSSPDDDIEVIEIKAHGQEVPVQTLIIPDPTEPSRVHRISNRNLTDRPTNPAAGDIFLNTYTNTYYVYTGTNWARIRDEEGDRAAVLFDRDSRSVLEGEDSGEGDVWLQDVADYYRELWENGRL
jgi:hypothetical protein